MLLDPAMQVDAEHRAAAGRASATATRRSPPPTRRSTCRLADPALFTTPRATIAGEVAEHLERGEDGRYRWRFFPPMAIVAWSEMATAAPPWPACPTLVVVGAQSWILLDVPDDRSDHDGDGPGRSQRALGRLRATAEAIAGFVGIGAGSIDVAKATTRVALAVPGLRRAAGADQVLQYRALRVLDAVRAGIGADERHRGVRGAPSYEPVALRWASSVARAP